MEIINYLAIGIAISAASIICWGVLLSLIRFIKLEFQRLRGTNIFIKGRYSGIIWARIFYLAWSF